MDTPEGLDQRVPERQLFRERLHQSAQFRLQAGQDGLAQQRLHGTEVVVDQRRVDAGTLRNGTRTHSTPAALRDKCGSSSD